MEHSGSSREWDRETDFLVVGSGGGGLMGALAARALGADALVIEKQSTLGGNTCLSGGTMWIPDNPLMRREGLEDSMEAGIEYLDATVGEPSPASSPARKRVYVEQLQRMADFLLARDFPLMRAKGYPDYYDQMPGGNAQGRVLQFDFFDLNELGPDAGLVANPPVPFIATVREAPELCMALRSPRALATLARVMARTGLARLRKQDLASNGAALVGRLAQAALRQDVEFMTDTPMEDLVLDGDRVVGVTARADGREISIGARRGVLIASGGFARNAAMREQYGRVPTSQEWTMANPGETGEVVEALMRVGAETALMDEGIWMPMSLTPEGPLYNVYERAAPHAIIVNRQGRRFVDEAATYMKVSQEMYAEEERGGGGVPCWIVIDARHRRRYPWGLQPPGRTPKHWLTEGYMKRAETIGDLALLCGMEPAALAETIERFNGFARDGVDPDFHRAESVYGKFFGDPRNKPNPGLGTLEEAPFYAVALYPGDLGNFGGVITDEKARVLRAGGAPIEGLYATGTATAPVTGRTYPATGSSIGGTMVWGFVAAQDAFGPIDLKP